MNLYTPRRYDERITHLSLGLEPRDATTDQRLDRGVDVRIERFPRPVAEWRRWAPGESLTTFLPSLERHRSGRFAARYEDPRPLGPTPTLRVVDDELVGSARRAGHGRRFVPRRITTTLAPGDAVRSADADPTVAPHPLWQRAFPLWMFPGASGLVSPRATVLRGRVVRVDPADGRRAPVRWCRVRAVDTVGRDAGWAHGDDRGEFVLVAQTPVGEIGPTADPLRVELSIGARPVPPAPDPADPTLAEVDPLWDLPVETVAPAPVASSEPTLTGRAFLPLVHTVVAPVDPTPIALALGRQTTREIQIP
ncbi:MAG: hypothetical protein AAFY28_11215 [Actinomycetota bacterium]